MKFEFKEESIIIYLIKNIEDKLELEQLLKYLIKKLKYKYNKELNGSYTLNIYTNKIETIFEIIDDRLDFYFDKLDMEVKLIKDASFIYKIDYIYINNFKEVYKYKDEYYVKNINIKQIEFVKVLFGDVANNIIKKCKKVNI